jgi:hypothetical protein
MPFAKDPAKMRNKHAGFAAVEPESLATARMRGCADSREAFDDGVAD